VRSSLFAYDLPADRIAQHPAEPRSAARLLVATDPSGGIEHRTVAELPGALGPGDVLVVNDTRVMPARLRLRKATGGAVEVLLLRPAGIDGGWGAVWEALVRPGRRVPPGTPLVDHHGAVVAEVGDRLDEGRRQVTLVDTEAIDRVGAVALPPYITTPLADPERYQTVYAARPGSVAAPTAGLHLTAEVLDACRARGVEVHRVELAIGLDTFRPITTDEIENHRMHSEAYVVPEDTLAACRQARRVVAVGTTTVRALETAVRGAGAGDGRTGLFIRPGFEFQVVDLLLTNFHVPRSSLLVLLAAFCGERWRFLYEQALAAGYRFLSLGDCMLVVRAA
jgi:S-adenosylmethionine:tRNA ribosyltransferase-isomerase